MCGIPRAAHCEYVMSLAVTARESMDLETDWQSGLRTPTLSHHNLLYRVVLRIKGELQADSGECRVKTSSAVLPTCPNPAQNQNMVLEDLQLSGA